jgi:hypothetical protein
MPRRLDPTGKRALFETPVSAAPDQLAPGATADGRGALFSAGPARTGTVVIDCSSCRSRARITLAELGVRALSLSAFVPTRRSHPYWLRCPTCGHRTWCRIGWSE